MSKANVLLPEEERVAARVAEDTMRLGHLVTDSTHALDGCHEVGCLPQSIEVEGELSKLQRLCSRDCQKERQLIRYSDLLPPTPISRAKNELLPLAMCQAWLANVGNIHLKDLHCGIAIEVGIGLS